MYSIDDLMNDLQRALGQALADADPPPALLRDPTRLVTTIVEGEARRLASQARLGIPVPRFCIFSVTWQCNLKCVGCYARNYTRGRELDLDQIERITREAAELGSVFFVIVGGEPLTVPGLIDRLATINEAIFFLFTNGTLLTPDHAAIIARSGNILPVVSVEGDRTLTDARRGGGVGRKVQQAMDLLHEAGAAFGFSTMITHRNLHMVTSRPWFDDVWAAGARWGFLIDYIPFPHDLDPSLVLTDDDRAVQRKAVLERQHQARPFVLNFPPDEYATDGCQSAGRGFIHINADGYVEPCPFSHWAADNVRDRSLVDILASPFFAELRRTFADMGSPRGECLLFARAEQVADIAERTGAFVTEQLPLPSSPDA